MNRDWLEAELGAGRSIEAIARGVGKDPSTVGYWMRKHGLASEHATQHARRGGVDRAVLEALVADGLTQLQIAARLGLGGSTVRYWLKRHGLRTQRAHEVSVFASAQDIVMRRCRTRGWTEFVATGSKRQPRCRRCRSAHVSKRRRRLKEILVTEAGGACVICGYDRYHGALHFHHLAKAEKAFALSDAGVARSIAAARREAQKCVLVCANCHAEVECGLATLPP